GVQTCALPISTTRKVSMRRRISTFSVLAAASTENVEMRRRMLTFLVVGGGYAGVEALAELADMSRYASRYYENVERSDLRWVLVEAAGRIMPEVSAPMGRYTVERLMESGIEVFLDTRVDTMVNGH